MCSADVGAGGGRRAGRGFAVKLRSLFGKLWQKDGAKQGQKLQYEALPKMARPKIATVESMAEQLKQLKIPKHDDNLDETAETDEEHVVVTKVVNSVRHTSKDSGYSDKNDDYVDTDDDDFKTVQITISKKVGDSKIELNKGEDSKVELNKGEHSKIEQEQIKDGGQDFSKNVNSDGKKPKQLKKVFLSRQPIRNNIQLPSIGPYPSRPQQFQQVNHQTLSGCQVTINSSTARDIDNIKQNLLDVNLDTIKQNLLDVKPAVPTQLTNHEQEETLNDLMEMIGTDPYLQPVADVEKTNYIIGNVIKTDHTLIFDEFLLNSNMAAIPSFGTSNPSVYKSAESNGNIMNWNSESTFGITEPVFESPESGDIINWNLEYESIVKPLYQNPDLGLKSNDLNIVPTKPIMFLTPPPSNESMASTSPHNRSKNDSESMYSPHRYYSSDISQTSPIYAEHEVFQAIQNDEIPKCVEFKMAEKVREKKKDGLMNLKQYKEVMKKMEAGFAKLDCCNAQDREDVTKDCYKKLSPEDRRQMSLVLAKCSLEAAYGLLYKLLESLSSAHEREHYLTATFVTICNRIRDERPLLYLSEFGVDLLAACCLVCPVHPHLTRHVVSCVRTALAAASVAERRNYVFDTVDTSGDNLIGACARRGDLCASVLFELTNTKQGEVALFNVDHVNSEGLSALHVACSCEDGAPRTHTVHVLLAHAHADLWKKDIKSGDLPLHHALSNSLSVCDLTMCLFLHVDNTKWYSLAKAKNYSSLTPLLKAKGASTNTAEDSPISQVYRFLTKCRPKASSISDYSAAH